MDPTPVVGVLIILVGLGIVATHHEIQDLCPRKHDVHGQCRLKPNHWPQPHRNARGRSFI